LRSLASDEFRDIILFAATEIDENLLHIEKLEIQHVEMQLTKLQLNHYRCIIVLYCSYILIRLVSKYNNYYVCLPIIIMSFKLDMNMHVHNYMHVILY